ncbi:MAG: hypothetical protein EAZ95_17480, partial [Bacteroidetes bacterium]
NILDKDNALSIFQDLLGEVPKNNRVVRLFDDTKNLSVVFRENHKTYGTHIHNYSTGEHYTAVNAYMKAHGLEGGKGWQQAVTELGKEYRYLPHDYDSTPYQKRTYTPKPQPTEQERREASRLANPSFGVWSDAHLGYWAKFGIAQALLEQYGVKPLQSFDLMRIETGEKIKTHTPELAFAYTSPNNEGIKKYQPKDKKYKWQWIGENTKSNILWGLEQLPAKCAKIVIVEGLKDAMAVVAHFSAFGIYAVGLDNAGQKISANDLETLRSKVENEHDVFLCLDNDKTGKAQNALKTQEYGLSYLPYKPEFVTKDFADLVDSYEKIIIKEWLLNGAREGLPTEEATTQASPQSDKEAQKEAKRLQREAEKEAKRLRREAEKEAKEKALEALQKEKREKELAKFFRVGDTYYELVSVPNKFGTLETDFHVRHKQTIKDDFGSDAIYDIPKYKAFCLVPNHTHYKQVIAQCYNTYFELPHKPAQGDCPHTLAMIKHIFGDKYDLGLDYLQLLYTEPTQRLPILGLVSQERNTGKSTFGQWLLNIYGQNGRKLGNGDLGGDFNDFYASRLLIVVDETEIEKRMVSEAVKRMSTETGKIIVNAKGKAHTAQDFIGKFIFISNNEDNFINIGKGETRYLVLKINHLEQDIPNLEDILIKEIPAFLHFISQRKLVHERVGRMYFDANDLHTEQLERVIEASKSPIERALLALVRETFEAYNTEIELYFGLDDLYEELKNDSKYASKQGIRDIIKRELQDKFEYKTTARYKYHSLSAFKIWDSDIAPETLPQPQKRNNVHYLVKVQNFLSWGDYYQRTKKQGETPKTSTTSTGINNEELPF